MTNEQKAIAVLEEMKKESIRLLDSPIPEMHEIVTTTLDTAISRIKERSKEDSPTTDEDATLEVLLEEMRQIVRNLEIKHDRFEWFADGYNTAGTKFRCYGKTPREALLALREKLSK